MTPPRVEAMPALLRSLRRLAAAAHPLEGCGCLTGRTAGGSVVLLEALPGRNLRVDRARDRYELDPADIVRADREARSGGLDVVGFWHTHPDAPARPSAFDTERAWPEYVYVIASTSADGVRDVRAYVLEAEGGEFTERAIHAIDG